MTAAIGMCYGCKQKAVQDLPVDLLFENTYLLYIISESLQFHYIRCIEIDNDHQLPIPRGI